MSDSPVHSIRCESVAEFLTVPKAVPGGARESRDGTLEFTQTHSWDEAVALIAAGWPAGAKAAAKALLASGSTRRDTIELVYDVAGGSVDIGAYLSGAPDCMIDCRLTPDPRGGRVLPIRISAGVSSDWSTEAMGIACAAVAQAVDSAEQAGIRCEVVVSFAASNPWTEKQGDFVIDVVVKAASDPLDLPRIAGMMHPSALRRIVFGWMESVAPARRSYGWPLKLDDAFVLQSLPRDQRAQWPKIATDWLTEKANAEQ